MKWHDWLLVIGIIACAFAFTLFYMDAHDRLLVVVDGNIVIGKAYLQDIYSYYKYDGQTYVATFYVLADEIFVRWHWALW